MKSFFALIFGAITLRVLAAGATYVSMLFLGRWLGTEDFGRFATLLSSVMLLTVVVAMGVPMGLLRAIGELRATGWDARVPAVIRATSRRPVGLSVLLAVAVSALWLIAWQTGVALPASVTALLASLLLLPAFLMAEINAAVLRSFDRITAALAPRDVLWRLALLPIGYGVARVFAPGQQFLPLLLTSVVVLSGLVILQNRLVRRLFASLPPDSAEADQAGIGLWHSLRPVTRRIWVTNVAALGMNNLDVIAVSLFVSAEFAGPYFLASRTAALVSFTLNAIGMVLAPRLSAAHFSDNAARLRGDLRQGALLAALSACAGFGCLVVFGKAILSFADDSFIAFYPVLCILAAGHAINGLTGPSALLLNMTGHEGLSARISFAALCLSVPAIALGGHVAGVLGIAIGMAGAMIALELCLYVASCRVTGYDSSVLGYVQARPVPNHRA